MKEENNRYEQDLFRIWETASRLSEPQKFTKMEIEKILNNASREMSHSFQKGIYLDIALKSVLLAGFACILLYSLTNIFVLITSLIFIITGGLLLLLERKMLKSLHKVNKITGSIKNSIEEQLGFYNAQIYKYPLSVSFSAAMFYVLGSMIYHSLVYGTIHPIRDMTDAIVLSSFMLAGVVISVVANLPYFKGRIDQLDNLLKDMEDPEVYSLKIQKLKIKKQRDFILYTVLAIAGVLVLAFLLVSFHG